MPTPIYTPLRELLKSGFRVELNPKRGGSVELVVMKAGNGTKQGVNVDLNPLEWGLVQDGIADRLTEALERLTP